MNSEAAPFASQRLASQLSAIEMSEADLMGATATTGVEVLVRLLEWCCCAFTVGASCACVRNITIVVVKKKMPHDHIMKKF